MSRDDVERAIVCALAERVCQRLTRRAITRLQSINGEALLSGDDSGLQNTWDEICVQVQSEESFAWDSYDQTVRACLQADVEELARHEQEAIWLQTPRGLEWAGEEDAKTESCPVDHSDIIDYLLAEYVYAAADRWSNARIRGYLDGQF